MNAFGLIPARAASLRLLAAAWAGSLLVVWAPIALAHEVRPALLELAERSPGVFDVLWKVPALGGVPLAGEDIAHEQLSVAETPGVGATMPCGCSVPVATRLAGGVLPIHPAMPAGSEILEPARAERLQGTEIRRWTIRTGENGLDGWQVAVHGLSATMVDVLVRIATADGRVVSHVLRPDEPAFVFHAGDAGASGYFRLGVEHILLGIDHLLFVLCLLLLVRGAGPILKTITAFTLAHSITLGLATLGYVAVPPAPVEATIALSIVFLATEVAKRRAGAPSFTQRKPWLIAFTFGLLHGFGFAGALSDVGLPSNDIPLALLLFNVGVEAGQLCFVAFVLAGAFVARRIPTALPAWLRPAPVYAIGAIASFWLIDRVTALW
jgi:hydrogenase/urease accessory protein HupE